MCVLISGGIEMTGFKVLGRGAQHILVAFGLLLLSGTRSGAGEERPRLCLHAIHLILLSQEKKNPSCPAIVPRLSFSRLK